MKTIRRDTNLHPKTITAYSTGTLTPLPGKPHRTSHDRRAPSTSATVLPDRIWIDTTTGDLWVLNHPRTQTCNAGGCPHCTQKRRRSA